MRWSWDIECEAWTRHVVSVAISDRGQVVVMRTDDDVREWYFSTDKDDEVCSFYGGGYDFLYLISITKELQWRATLAGGNVSSATNGRHASLRDVNRLFPGSLSDWTGKKESLDLPCECGEQCGGYCSIRVGMSGPSWQRLVDYCVNDTRILHDQYSADVSRSLAEGWEMLDKRGRVRGTCGGVAWATAVRVCDLDPRAIDRGEYRAARRGYYGGRCEVGATILPADTSIFRYDVHAMYPWALTLPVPIGQPTVLHGEFAMRALVEQKPGVYTGVVKLPDTDISLLPHRFVGKTWGPMTKDRLVWSNGIVEGTWSHIELGWALDNGAKIVSIKQARVYPREAPIYEPYMRFYYDSRAAAKAAGDERWAAVLKWRGNSLTGKLAQRPNQHSVRILAENEDPLPLMKAGWSWLRGRVWVSPSSNNIPACARPIHAVTLTSRAHVKVGSRLLRHQFSWVYCDTDSTYLQQIDNTDVHDSELGSYGFEGEGKDWRAPAPKVYGYLDSKGKRHIRCKGIPRINWEQFENLLRGETISQSRGVEKLKSGKAFERRTLKRTLRGIEGFCGTRVVLPSGRTRPLQRTVENDYL